MLGIWSGVANISGFYGTFIEISYVRSNDQGV